MNRYITMDSCVCIGMSVASGDDYRSPQLREANPSPRSQPTAWDQPKKTLRTVDISLSFARVFKPCQFKHSKELKAFKQKTRESSNEYSRTVFRRREPRLHQGRRCHGGWGVWGHDPSRFIVTRYVPLTVFTKDTIGKQRINQGFCYVN